MSFAGEALPSSLRILKIQVMRQESVSANKDTKQQPYELENNRSSVRANSCCQQRLQFSYAGYQLCRKFKYLLNFSWIVVSKPQSFPRAPDTCYVTRRCEKLAINYCVWQHCKYGPPGSDPSSKYLKIKSSSSVKCFVEVFFDVGTIFKTIY